jgi:hypothetical protein
MGDIKFRGAISDFHVIKSKIEKSNYDPLIVRYNHDDKYGDGNNFEVCCLEVRRIERRWRVPTLRSIQAHVDGWAAGKRRLDGAQCR